MSTHMDCAAGTGCFGETLGGWFENLSFKDFGSLAGWTAKMSLLLQPLLTATVDHVDAELDLATFDPTTGRVFVKCELVTLQAAMPAGIPAGDYRVRWHLYDATGLELRGPMPKLEQTIYRFGP